MLRSSMLRPAGLAAVALVTLAAAPLAMAHGEAHATGGSGLLAGLLHPVTGLDHLLAMVLVGVLACRAESRKALWAVPLAFVGMMAAGALVAMSGLTLPGMEQAIAASVLVLGLAVAVAPKVRLAWAAPLVGVIAIFHGWAHIAEMHGGLAGYLTGFLTGTAALHAAGLGIGMGLTQMNGVRAVRITGGLVAAGFAVALCIGL